MSGFAQSLAIWGQHCRESSISSVLALGWAQGLREEYMVAPLSAHSPARKTETPWQYRLINQHRHMAIYNSADTSLISENYFSGVTVV